MTSSSSARRRQGRRLTPLWTSARHTAVWRAVELILRTARGSDGLTIIAIGPLTNLAAALVADPALAGRLAQVVVMGGAFEVPGNVTPAAEFNFFMDPEAAQIVLESGVRPVLVGLDVCNQTHLTSRQSAATGFTTELGQFVQRSCAAWLPPMEAFDDEGPHLYDTLAVASVFRPGLLTLEAAFVQIETASDALAGTSVAWLPGRPSAWSRPDAGDNALVATGVDVSGFEALFSERVLAPL
jgi:purine nucleosidase